MKLAPESKQWSRLWSIRFAILAAAFGALEGVLPIWREEVGGGTFAILSTVAAAGAAVSRVIKQNLPEENGHDGADS